jgi:PiT family inorganic phosphate transporter
MEIIQVYGPYLLFLAGAFGLYMAWGIGANDVANAMGTSVGTKSLTVKQAIIIAMIFEFAGAYLAGGEVTDTVRKGIVDLAVFKDTNRPDALAFGMISALLAAGTWLMVASLFGWPVSTTHSIVGAIVGFALVSVGPEAVQWGKAGGIVGSWVITPILSGLIAYVTFISIQKLIFDTKDPLANAKRYVPFYIALTTFVIAMVTIKKGLKHVGLHLTTTEGILASALFSLIVAVAGAIYISKQKYSPSNDKDMHFSNVEKVFGILMVITACAMAFAHGSNDVANAIGPLAAVVSIVEHGGVIAEKAELTWWILPLGGLGIVVGLATMGHKVMSTVGTGITELTPSRGFAAQLATATTVVIASGSGLPISTTQTLVGGVLGVGMARGIAALNLNVVRTIVISWVVTLPAGALLSIIFYKILEAIFVV